MMRCFFTFMQFLLATSLVGCTNSSEVVRVDLTKQKGVYLVGYSTEPSARIEFEDELQRNLSGGGMLAYASHADIPDVTKSNATEIFENAKMRDVVAIVIINDTNDSTVEDVRRLQMDTPNVREHFDRVRKAKAQVADNDVVLEVNAFAIDGDTATLAWSGITAVFAPASRAEAVRDLSDSIAGALRSAQRQIRAGS